MRYFSKLPLLAAVMLLACIEGSAQAPYEKVGKIATADDIKALDIWVGPHGEGLPPGSGTAKQGQVIFTARCAMCHGPNGEGGAPGSISDPYGVGPRLVGGVAKTAVAKTDDKQPVNMKSKGNKESESVGSFWSSAPAVWEFINRAMPQNNPGSLKPDQVYAVLAFILSRNSIIKEDDVLDAKSLAKVQMPNRDGFVPANPVYPMPPAESGGCGSQSCMKVPN
jgi:mono/diheme cytochrome c family protein